MSLSTEKYGFIIDPFFSFMDEKGNPIKNGFLRVFLAGSSTPAVTYLNWAGAMNQETIQLDNSGRCYTRVIGAKGTLYKVVVYNILHSQENPLLTVDNVQVISSAADVLDGSVTTQKIADEAVTAAKLHENAVTTLKLANEAVTTEKLANSSVTENKLTNELKLKVIKDYVTPEMFGAVGDGTTDDTDAVQAGIDAVRFTNKYLLLTNKYKITRDLEVSSFVKIHGNNRNSCGFKLYNGAKVNLHRTEGDQIVYETTLKNFEITNYGNSTTCLDFVSSCSQCFFDNMYFGGGKDLVNVIPGHCVDYNGSINFFTNCYFYYATSAFYYKRGAQTVIDKANFWLNDVAFDVLGDAYLDVTNSWVEKPLMLVNIHECNPTIIFTNCYLLGSDSSGYKLLANEDVTSSVSQKIIFNQCRIFYPGETGYLMTPSNNFSDTRIIFSKTYVFCPNITAIIDNSLVDWRKVAVEYDVFGGTDYAVFADASKGVQLGLHANSSLVQDLNSGVVIGSKKPAADAILKTQAGYLYWSGYHLTLANGTAFKTIPFASGDNISKLENTAQLSDVITTVNAILASLGKGGIIYTNAT